MSATDSNPPPPPPPPPLPPQNDRTEDAAGATNNSRTGDERHPRGKRQAATSKHHHHKRRYLSFQAPARAGSSNDDQPQDPSRPPPPPRRRFGGPGILWTCETGLERKCRHQAMEILSHYYELCPDTNNSSDQGASSDPLRRSSDFLTSTVGAASTGASRPSLEEELAQLRRAPTQQGVPFSVYETKCRGIVVMLCKDQSRFLTAVPSAAASEDGAGAAKRPCLPADDDDNDDDETTSARDEAQAGNGDNPSGMAVRGLTPIEADHPEASAIPGTGSMPWDPLTTVRAIIRDLKDERQRKGASGLALSSSAGTGNCLIPSSRFVTRMIPLQVTCYASLPDLKSTFSALLQWYLSSSTGDEKSTAPAVAATATDMPSASTTTTSNAITYMVQSKRRHCDNLTSKDVIDGVAGLVPSHWKVDLRHPQLVVWVEICTNVAGMSIVPAAELREMFHFNLLQARTASVSSE